MIDKDILIEKILNLTYWLDGTILVVSRDAVIDIIESLEDS